MRWGVRKARASRAKTPSKPTAEARKAHELRRKPAHELTNKQLEVVNKRLNLEQNYSKLNPNAVKRGIAGVTLILGTAQLGVTAYNMLKSPAAQALVKNGKKALKVQQKRGQLTLF